MAEWTTEDVRAAAIYGPTRDSLDYPEKEVRERLRGEGFDAQGIQPDAVVTRIEWRYVCSPLSCECGGCVQ